jgi:L-malate glycosyltransferase
VTVPVLLVIVPDRLSQIIAKGEHQPRYYNPGELFDEVHLLMTNDDQPPTTALQRMVGGQAKLLVHNHPEDLTLPARRPGSLRGWRLRRWARDGVDLARAVGPHLIRCHGADWNGYLASRIKRTLGTPYVVSLHINPDVNPVRRFVKARLSPVERRHNRFYEYIERVGLRHADLVMPVYQPILPYLARMGVTNLDVCYNVLDGSALRAKIDYTLHQPARIISVGRLFEDKNPESLIRAVARVPAVELTIVGDGPIRERLLRLVERLDLGRRVQMIPAMPNDELCRRLVEHDIFAVHTEYWEINKSILEALLTGLPVIVNRRRGPAVPELEGDFVIKVENTEEGYREAIQRLLHDDVARAALGRRALAHARERWDPEITEARYAAIYRRFMRQAG